MSFKKIYLNANLDQMILENTLNSKIQGFSDLYPEVIYPAS